MLPPLSGYSEQENKPPHLRLGMRRGVYSHQPSTLLTSYETDVYRRQCSPEETAKLCVSLQL